MIEQAVDMLAEIKIWSDIPGEFSLEELVGLPIGYIGRKCPRCNSSNISGAIILRKDTIDNLNISKEDPRILCLKCGFWDDSFPN